MRGGQVFMESLLLHGTEAIFGNPGTTENPLLDRLIDYPDLRYYVALHEGVAVGAANLYAQASGKTGVVNLHVAPGLGNGIGMIYGALKTCSPLLVTAGQQDTRMRHSEPILGHDLVAMAAPVTKQAFEPQTADELGPLLQQAFAVANEPPCGPVFVALPVDVMEQETEVPASRAGERGRPLPAAEAIGSLAELLATSVNPCFVVGDDPARDGAFAALIRLVDVTAATVYSEGLRAHTGFPNRHPAYRGRLPFEAGAVQSVLAPHDLVVLIGTPYFEDVWFDATSHVPAEAKLAHVQNASQRVLQGKPYDVAVVGDIGAALDGLSERLAAAGADYAAAAQARRQQLETGAANRNAAAGAALDKVRGVLPMAPVRAIAELARAVPDDVIIVDESITASLEVGHQFEESAPGDYYGARGGGIGQGIPGAIGVQVAQPGRPVLAISGDGSAMYSIQTLWTAAHHDLPIVFVILSNREYRVLKHNLDIYRQRFGAESNKPYPHMDLGNPTLDFPTLARGMGVDGEIVEDPEAVAEAVARGFAAKAPYLIEIVVSGKQ